MSRVFVISSDGQPLDPCHPARARRLLQAGNATVWRQYPFTIRLITASSTELARFDTQALQNPEISDIADQHGTLVGYEVRAYLLETWERRCAYCHATDTPLQVEHIVPKARGGSDRVSNLTLACEGCNTRKGTRTADEFGFPHIQQQARQPLKDAATVNSTRWALYQRLVATGLSVEVGTGGRTRYNRARLGLHKTHWIDAAVVGASTPDSLVLCGVRPLLIRATGQGNRQMCRTDTHGFPNRHKPRAKRYQGFKTGDLVRAVIPTGKYKGTYTGRISIRHRPSFRLHGFNVHPRYLTRIHRADGYDYTYRKEDGVASPAA